MYINTQIPALSAAVLLPLVAPRLLTDDPLATFKGAYIKKSRRPAWSSRGERERENEKV